MFYIHRPKQAESSNTKKKVPFLEIRILVLKSPLSTGTLTIELGCMLGSALKTLLRDVSSPSGFHV